jgi:hypothetical protein
VFGFRWKDCRLKHYGGKSHPEIFGADLVVTYTAIGSDERLVTDRSIYYPRFVRVSLADLKSGV